MKSYRDMINKLCDILLKKELPYENTIIIGDNSCGKSEVLKELIKNDDENKLYFIDAVNRYFDVSQIMISPVENIMYSSEINKHRIEEDNFNYRDSFYYGGTPRAIEELYANFSERIKEMLAKFLNVEFDIKLGKVDWEVYINKKKVDLSSGYQALIRILLETIYFANTKVNGTIVIDEIDEFLSAKNSGIIFGFLKREFPTLKFIVTTHSADLISNAVNANLVLLHEKKFEILDAGDFTSISQVYNIFNSAFQNSKEKTEKVKIDENLRTLLNNKMSGVWGIEEDKILQVLKGKNITKTQKMIIRQIEAWKTW